MFGTITALLYQRKLWVSQITVFRIAREERCKHNFYCVFRKKYTWAEGVLWNLPPCSRVTGPRCCWRSRGCDFVLELLPRERDGSGATDLGDGSSRAAPRNRQREPSRG